MTRTFETKIATRSPVPLWLGLVSPSGGGKTYSALEMATGIQRVVGGEIAVIDTERGRATHYADKFRFQHCDFAAPFSPLDYLGAIEHCHKQGAKVIVIDSASHEHEGPGGLLEMHEQEAQRMAREWGTSIEKVKLGAWTKPKQDRRRLINTMLQIPVHFILCFRAKKKLKIEKGKDPLPLGWMPIAGEEWIFECTMNCMLYPNARGVPTWEPSEPGEREMIKLPEQFRSLMLEKYAGQPLNRDLGQALALWAAGDAANASDAETESALAAIVATTSAADLKSIAANQLRSKNWNADQRAKLQAAIESQKAKLKAA